MQSELEHNPPGAFCRNGNEERFVHSGSQRVEENQVGRWWQCELFGIHAHGFICRYMFKFDKEHLPLDVPFPDAKRRNIASSDRWDILPKRGPKFQIVKHGTPLSSLSRPSS
jgi:hypothetical protein